MSKKQSLISNLNEIIEEYVENEEEATFELQIMVMQEAREETELPAKQSRKRKRNTTNAETEQEEEEDELISNAVYVVMKDTLKQKNFIGERSFDKLISLFREVIEKRGWNLFSEHKTTGFAALVRESYVNKVGKKEKTVYVRGKWISFVREAINKTYNLKELKDGSKFKKLQKELDFQMILELLTSERVSGAQLRRIIMNPLKTVTYRGSEGVVLLHRISLTPFKTPEHSLLRRSSTLVCIIEGVHD